jgi:hypothetical protein
MISSAKSHQNISRNLETIALPRHILVLVAIFMMTKRRVMWYL